MRKCISDFRSSTRNNFRVHFARVLCRSVGFARQCVARILRADGYPIGKYARTSFIPRDTDELSTITRDMPDAHRRRRGEERGGGEGGFCGDVEESLGNVGGKASGDVSVARQSDAFGRAPDNGRNKSLVLEKVEALN